MTWTTPATWTTDEVVTAAKMNEQVRDNCAFLYSAKVASVGSIATTTITTSTWTLINFAFEVSDTVGAWSSGAPSRFTPPVAGYYLIQAAITWAADATLTGGRSARLLVNGTTVYDQDTRAAINNTQQCKVSRVIYFNGSTDYVEVQAWQSKGSDHNLSSAGHYMELIWIGA